MENKKEMRPEENISDEHYIFDTHRITPQIVMITVCVIFGIIFLIFALVGLTVLRFSETYRVYGVIGISVSAVVVIFNIWMILFCIQILKFYRRYQLYNKIMGVRNIELVDDVAYFSGQSALQVQKDLKKAIKKNLIPQGHFAKDDTIIILTNAAYNDYLEKQEVLENATNDEG